MKNHRWERMQDAVKNEFYLTLKCEMLHQNYIKMPASCTRLFELSDFLNVM